MPWLRVVYWDFKFNCCYEGNAQLAKDGIYRNLRYLKRFAKRQIDDVEEWAKIAAEELSRDRADYACTELAAKFSGCLIEVFNLRYSEVLIPEIKVVPPAVVPVEEIVPVRVPTKLELDQLAEFEKKLAEYEKKAAEYKINIKILRGELTRLRSSLKVQEIILKDKRKQLKI